MSAANIADNLRSTRTGRFCTMARNPTEEILYDGSNDQATLLMSLIGPDATLGAAQQYVRN
ncbi:hypothetical protein AAV28_36285 [Bradyrhizobium diazoefficiens USDA 110]|nr:hypothetical protein AAV28_36285 [Bradyrhizobium diazoefficiens USDA 110]